jgi:hypothetical protein
MVKTTEQDKITYQEKIKCYKESINALLITEKDILLDSKNNTPDSHINKMTLVDGMLDVASNFLAINGVSQAVFKNRNEDALNEGRKSIYKAVIYLENIVSNYIDAPFTDYEEKLSLIEAFDSNQRYSLIRKMGFAIDLLKNTYGDNSKWKWAFVEIEGRYATVAKNIVDLRHALDNTNPESPYYESTVYHLRLVKKLLAQAASRYRDKYELSTGLPLDFKMGISFLAALRRLHIVFAENEDAEELKKKLHTWTTKLETDVKKQEEAKRKI